MHSHPRAPCNYAFLGLGSLGRGEMSPYSDLEFAIVLEQDSPDIKTYFRHLTRLLELQVIALNETAFPLLQQGFYSPVVSGFSFDSGGNTPLGKEGAFELIGTPGQLAQFQEEKWFQSELITSNVLKTGCCLAGDPPLVTAYDQAISQVLNQKLNQPLKSQEEAPSKLSLLLQALKIPSNPSSPKSQPAPPLDPPQGLSLAKRFPPSRSASTKRCSCWKET